MDRLHPNERGHRFLACQFHALLAAAGFPVGPEPDPEPSTPPPSRMAEIRWMATKGTTWLARRSRDLVPALVALAIREWLTADDDVAERELAPAPESVIQNRLASTRRLGQGERPGSVIQNRPTEHGLQARASGRYGAAARTAAGAG